MKKIYRSALAAAVAGALAAVAVSPLAGQEEEETFPLGAPEEPAKEWKRKADPSALVVPPGYKVEVWAKDLTYITDLTFGPDGTAYVSEAGGHTFGTDPAKAPPAQVLQRMPDGSWKVIFANNVPIKAIREADTNARIPEGIIGPLEGVTYNPQNGLLYLAHRSRYSVLNPKTGEFKTIIDGLPAWGIFHNSKAIFDPQGRLVFEVSTQGNSGMVDQGMLKALTAYNKRLQHEIPCETVTLTGRNLTAANDFTPEKGDSALTGVYVPFGVVTQPGQTIEGQFICNGAFYRANPDGTNIQRIAWGFRDPYHYAYSPSGRLIASDNSGEAIAPRRVFNDWERFWEVKDGLWYGWPDYFSGLPITDERFYKPNDPNYKGKPQPHEFALTAETRARLLKGEPLPPQPLARVVPHSGAQGFAFGRPEWGMDPENEVILAEFGTLQLFTTKGPNPPGFMLSIVNLETGERRPFIYNQGKREPASASKETNPKGGGFERPLRPVWGPDGALYLVDFGRLDSFPHKGRAAFPNTGVIWRITKTDGAPTERTRIPVRKGGR